MKRILVIFALLLALPVYSMAWEQQINDIAIDVTLNGDGSARVTETWDVEVASGTEWYLVRNNLGDIRISGLRVSDETGARFHTLPDWKLERSLEQKARTCGINKTSDGVELCWGVGSYGPHIFKVSYVMSNVVKSMDDYDCFHLQLVSPGLSARPQHVRVVIGTPEAALDTSNTRIWGFGFKGNADFHEGKVVYESTEEFVRNSSVIALMRFDKGLFRPASIRSGSFSTVLDTALEGSSYTGDDDDVSVILAIVFFLVAGAFIVCAMLVSGRKSIGKIKDKKRLMSLYGKQDMDNEAWCREVPFGGDIFETAFVASHPKGGDLGTDNFVEAFMLRMVQNGVLVVGKDSRGRTCLTINASADNSYMSQCESTFYSYLVEAAGGDNVLQEKEFKRWSLKHGEELELLVKSFRLTACSRLLKDGYALGNNSYFSPSFTDSGRKMACNAVGFRNYLKEFTIIDERQSVEVALWKDYLVAACIFGIADRVSKELKKLNPELYRLVMEQSSSFDPYDLIIFNRSFAYNFKWSLAAHAAAVKASASAGGFGGGTSFGGGGGFSGGGFGGGSR